MSYITKNPQELKDAILRRLGAPIINIEVTEDHIYDCIQRALELYGEYHYDGVHKSYATFVVSEEQAKTGLFDLKNYNIYAVTQILRTNVGSLATMDGTATYPWFTDFLMSMTGSGSGTCNFYGAGSYMTGGGLSYFTQIMSYRSLMQNMLNPIPDYWYNDMSEQLKVSGRIRAGDLLVIEVYTKAYADVDSMVSDTIGYGFAGCGMDTPTGLSTYNNPNVQGSYIIGSGPKRENGAYNNRWVKDYATALVKELNGQILARHQGMQLPGGVTIDGIRLIEEAKLEIETLRDELEMLDPPPQIIMG